MHTTSSRKLKIACFLISLLINLILLWLFFGIPLHNALKRAVEKPMDVTFQEELPTPQQPPQQYPDVAALKAQASNFGNPSAQQQLPQETTQEQTAEEKKDIVPEEEQEQKPQEVEEKNVPEETILASATQEQNGTQAETKTEQKDEQQEQKPKKRKKRRKRPAKPKEKELTFADLAQGFLDTLTKHKDGKDWLNRKGNENIRPDAEEMKYLSYIHHICWHIQSSWKRYLAELPHMPTIFRSTIAFSLFIDKNGSLLNLVFQKYTDNEGLNTHIAKVIRDAAPFPEIPERFKLTQLTIPLNFEVIIDQSRPGGMRFR